MQELLTALVAVLRSRAFSAPAPAVARLVAEVRIELERGRDESYVVVWAGASALPRDVAVRVLLADPPAPLLPTAYRSGRVGLDPISADTARRLLTHTMGYDLAYTMPIASEERVDELVSALIGALRPPVSYWTNGTLGLPGDTHTWGALTAHTFDTGLIAADDEHVLVVWMMDED
jgi:hypothetical protein